MPTAEKVQAVEEMRGRMEDCTIAISTDYTGLPVSQITQLRRALRQNGLEYRVVKNNLAFLAADAAGRSVMKEIVEGPTAIAFGYGDPTESAKALSNWIRDARSQLKVRGAVMGDRALSADEVQQLAELPPKDILVAQLLGQMQGPIASLVQVLNGPIAGLARVLQRHIEEVGEPAS